MQRETITTRLISKIVASEPLSDPAIKSVATAAIVDYFSASFSACHYEACQKLLNLIAFEGGEATSWLVGQPYLATARQAALFNGFQAHLLDYDDTHADIRGHPSAVILSALFASLSPSAIFNSSPLKQITTDRFLSAYIIGIELMALLGRAVGKEHYQKGWHSTATLGGIAATAALCYLHQSPFIRSALAIATTKASGLRLLFGSIIKPLHAGMAAQAAIEATQFAEIGFTADCDFLDEKMGFLAIYGNGNASLDLTSWGKPWRILMPGLWFKKYPFCSAASYVADAAKQLLARYPFSITDITHIELIFSPDSDSALIYKMITDPAQGRFSAEFIVASILLNRPLSFATFLTSTSHHHIENENRIDAKITELMSKMKRRYDDHALGRYAKVIIYLKEGQPLSAEVAHPKGSPENPYSQAQLKAKFFDSFSDKQLAQSAYQSLLQFNYLQNIMNILIPLSKLFSKEDHDSI